MPASCMIPDPLLQEIAAPGAVEQTGAGREIGCSVIQYNVTVVGLGAPETDPAGRSSDSRLPRCCCQPGVIM